MNNPLRTQEAAARIVAAIESAELNTSGEIRVHVESLCKGDPVARTLYLFGKLKMQETAQRNGVLIYVAYKSHKLAIVGDEGIHRKVGEHFWDGIKEAMVQAFSKEEYVQGVCDAVISVGQRLKEYFPYQKDDVNEQSNEVSFGD